ncbi:MAG: HPr family phosphocarrier protein [Brevefilum sp.]|nr:HPr family phosphocarrier protein [Brevefilum sp.]
MQELTITVTNPVGLHARPAALFVKTAAQYESNITVDFKDKTANAKSILSVLSMGVGANSEIKIQAEGADEVEAIQALSELINSDFGE